MKSDYVHSYKNLCFWQRSMELVVEIYKLSEIFPRSELYGLTSQMRRCAISIASNIAEGFKRKTKNDSLHFYNMAQGSLEELKYQLLLNRDLRYISDDEYKKVCDITEEVGKLLYGWMKIQR